MKIKTVLKGIGRLMLTTVVMCGVGLFLCSSEVKAADVTVKLEPGDTSGEFVVTAKADSAATYTFSNVRVVLDSETLFTLEDPGEKNIGGSNFEKIASFDLLKGCNGNSTLDTLYSNKDKSLKVMYNYTKDSTTKNDQNSSETSVGNLYKIAIPSEDKIKYSTDKVYNPDDFSISAHNITYAAGKPGYLFGGESFDVNSSATTDYYVNVFQGNAGNGPDWYSVDSNDASVFKDGTNTTTFSFNPPSPAVNVTDLKVQYFPRFTQVWYDIPPAERTVYLDLDSTKTKSFSTDYIKFDNTNLNGPTPSNDRQVILSQMAFVPNLNGSSNINKWSSKYYASTVEINFGDSLNKALANLEQAGVAKVSVLALKPGASPSDPGTTPIINNATCPSPASLNVYAYPTGIAILKNGSVVTADKINVSTTPTTYTISVLPGGADQSIGTGTTTIPGSHSTAVVDLTNKTLKVTGQSAGTDTITVNAQVKTGGSSSEPQSTRFAVTVVALDKDKTISKINGGNENYITVGDYKLDVASLVSKYATDGTNHIDGITPKAIKITSSGSDYAEVVDSTKIKGKKEGTVELSIFLNTTDTSTTPDLTGVKIDVYPKPTATYSSSNRTLTVKMPTKVSTGYGEEKNIRKTTGFKLLLEDSSGNTLYEYTDSKYQKVLSSSSDKTVSYTVTASDIEGMVTSAASNGKFSSDTTSVKFKVIPMGYKQSNSEDETIKAKDEIAGTTDAVTVYKVSASGTNFTSTAAYGLDGQTVSLTATPNSGYTFKQWSDGNTSNPRQIKVSASGTRSFQAVAGERVANSTGAGGTDNSALYDDVPKTSESNSAIWLIVFMVFAVMGTTYALYLQLRAANSKHDR